MLGLGEVIQGIAVGTEDHRVADSDTEDREGHAFEETVKLSKQEQAGRKKARSGKTLINFYNNTSAMFCGFSNPL